MARRESFGPHMVMPIEGTSSLLPQRAITMPNAVPITDNTILSVRTCRTRRQRLAPCANRVASSRCRAVDRASNRFAMLSHAMTSTIPAMTIMSTMASPYSCRVSELSVGYRMSNHGHVQYALPCLLVRLRRKCSLEYSGGQNAQPRTGALGIDFRLQTPTDTQTPPIRVEHRPDAWQLPPNTHRSIHRRLPGVHNPFALERRHRIECFPTSMPKKLGGVTPTTSNSCPSRDSVLPITPGDLPYCRCQKP